MFPGGVREWGRPKAPLNISTRAYMCPQLNANSVMAMKINGDIIARVDISVTLASGSSIVIIVMVSLVAYPKLSESIHPSTHPSVHLSTHPPVRLRVHPLILPRPPTFKRVGRVLLIEILLARIAR